MAFATPRRNPVFKELDEKYKCQKCHGVARDCIKTPCGHRICQNCVEEMFQDGSERVQCPANKEGCFKMAKEEISPDHDARREIQKQIVYCTFRQYGCPKELQWRNLENHEKTCRFIHVDCKYKEYGCPEKVPKARLFSHEKECGYIPTPCQHCGQNVATVAMEDHLKNDCQAKEAPCPNNGGSPGMRKQEMKLVQQSERSLTEGHSNREKKNEKDVQNVERAIKRLRAQVTEPERRGPARGAVTNSTVTNSTATKHVLRNVNPHDPHLLQLAEPDPHFQNNNGVLLWKIDDYWRRKQDAMSGDKLSLYSPPFYTHSHGYQMCARVYFDGDGMGRGTHLSLFFVVMRGEYDDLLDWPFKHKVKMTLLDQATGEHHLSDTITPDPTSNSFSKPITELNIGSGSPLFVAHGTLETPTYLQEDTIIIKIEVQPIQSVKCNGIAN